jgi:hypothetical protein
VETAVGDVEANDPIRYITAGELRAAGVDLSEEDYPDPLWVPRSSITWDLEDMTRDADGFHARMVLHFSTPFRGVFFKVEIPVGD